MTERQRERIAARAARLISELARFDESIGQRRRLLVGLELAAAGAIVLVTGSYLWLMLRAMATTSLWTDEIHSVIHFSSRGPWTVITDYREANNHVFFNLLNSLTPVGDRFMPLRARFWSFVAVLGSLGFLLGHFARRRRYLEGALAFGAIASQHRLLDLALAARGYGLLFLAAVVSSLSIARFIETRNNRELYWLALASILGTWSVPTFILYSACALLLLWASFRTRAIFWCGTSVVVAVAVLYAPVYRQLVVEATTYAEQFRERFAHLSAVGETLAYLWTDIPDWAVIVVMLVALVVPYQLAPSAAVLAARLLSVVVFVTFVLFLLMKTPQVRTAAFLVIPLLFVLVSVGSELLRGKWIAPWLLSMATAVVLTVVVGVPHVRQFSYTPHEAWLEVATYIEGNFPPGTSVWAPFRSDFLACYLSSEYPVVEKFDAKRFQKGTQIVVDGNFRRKRRFDPKQHSAHATSVSIPQRRGQSQLIAFVPRSR